MLPNKSRDATRTFAIPKTGLAATRSLIGRARARHDGHSGKYVTLVSAEGFEYVVDYEAACVSNMIKNLMTSAGGFSELESNKIKFPEISGRCLEKVCQYFYYKLRHTNSKDKLPQFPLPPEMALELLMAANYLDV